MHTNHCSGFSLIELLAALAISALLIVALNGVINQTLKTHEFTREQTELTRQARFAMERMVRAIGSSPRLLLPLFNNPSTGYDESVRDVLAVTLDHETDLDGDGTPDADNDGDGRFDEDLPADTTNDSRGGIALIDDDNDGAPDTALSSKIDDDEDTTFWPIIADEDPIDGQDNDGDGAIDEDPPADMNNDGCPGNCNSDDDSDGTTDEGDPEDDDEDGSKNEDWYDPVVFYLNNGTLIERTPVPWDENGSGSITGADYIESIIAENVTLFQVERTPQESSRSLLVGITLELTGTSGETVNIHTSIRVGGLR